MSLDEINLFTQISPGEALLVIQENSLKKHRKANTSIPIGNLSDILILCVEKPAVKGKLIYIDKNKVLQSVRHFHR